MFIVNVGLFRGGSKGTATPDVNGKMPVILSPLNDANLFPTNRVLSGTVAENAGLIVGNVYLVKVTHTGNNSYGAQYQFERIGSELDPLDAVTKMGAVKGQIFVTPGVKSAAKEDVPVTTDDNETF